MEVVVKNGTPFLFNDADGSATRLRSFLSDSQASVRTETSLMHDQISTCSSCFNFLVVCYFSFFTI